MDDLLSLNGAHCTGGQYPQMYPQELKENWNQELILEVVWQLQGRVGNGLILWGAGSSRIVLIF